MFCLGCHSIIVHLLNLLVECLLHIVQLQLLRLTVDFSRTDAVASGETVEDGDVQAQTDILREIILQLTAETRCSHAARLVVVGLQAPIQRQSGIACRLCHLDALLGSIQTQLLSPDLGFEYHCLGKDHLGVGENQGTERSGRAHHHETLGSGQFQQLRQRQQCQLQIIVSLGGGQNALRMGGFLLSHLCPTRLPVMEERLKANHLHGVDGHLSPRHISQFHIIENLHIGLCHLHADVVLRFLQVFDGSL